MTFARRDILGAGLASASGFIAPTISRAHNIVPNGTARKQVEPFQVPSFRRIFDPSIDEPIPWYVNDHCFIQADDGTWHLIGITHSEPPSPADEKFFMHATASDLWGPWTKQPPILHAEGFASENHVWAPFVVKDKGLYWIYYAAGGDNHRFRMHLATSPDLFNWTRHAANPMFIDGYDARDPMVFRWKDHWILYYCGTRPVDGGESVVLAVTSKDLLQWSEPKIVYRTGETLTRGILCESPYVIERKGKFLLFFCTNRPYLDTAVLASDTPFQWTKDDRIGNFAAHAAEVIHTKDDRWFVSHCGYGQGGVYLSEFKWNI